MAKQLNLLSTGQVIPTALHTEMQQSYLEYAMSVIVGRALPDVRDGLKPVHRRILYAMHELGLTPDRPYRKCARVVGDVLGKYHPHGDQAVYDALVRMVQNFSTRYPLLDGHGNFGSVDNDPPAAMRYTETRLAPVSSDAMLSEIESATVDFIGNFDNSQQEPVVLPAQLPVLLLNGCSGIAVGMATNIPPHNLSEVVDGLIALIDKPDLTDKELFKMIPGPDFPTGGEIIDTDGIKSAYTTGKGSIVVRGITKIEEIQAKGRHRRNAIVVTELPFQVNKAAWIEKIAELVNAGKIEGISDIRDESDREGMRVVVELKREIDPQVILQHLYHQTALQSTFGAILLALVDQQPRQLTLRQLLQHFLNFREQTLTRRYTHELQKTEDRLHVVEGLLAALSNLDRLIEILRSSPDGTTAKVSLGTRLHLSERQADAILAMPMRRLTGLERQNLQTEFNELTQRRQQLKLLLDDRGELLKALKKDLRSLKKKYGDERRTRIVKVSAVSAPPPASSKKGDGSKRAEPEAKKGKKAEVVESLPSVPVEEAVLEMTQRGYVRRLPVEQNGKKKGKKVEVAVAEDVVLSVPAKTNQDILVLTRTGKAFSLKVGDVPDSSQAGRLRHSKGTPLVTLLPASAQSDPDGIVATFVIDDYLDKMTLIMVSEQGRIKRIPLLELESVSARGLVVMKLKDDDALVYAELAGAGGDVILATSGGRLLRFPLSEEQLPVTGRGAQGLQGVRLSNEHLVGCAVVSPGSELLLVTQLGYAKRMMLKSVRTAKRGDIGTQMIRFGSKTDSLAAMVLVSGGEVMVVSSFDRVLRVPVGEVAPGMKDDAGSRLRVLNAGEKVVSVRAIRVE
ncbi:DNA topoisomerase 4 subunit A [Ancylothrix sp. C2]|uniref:DNA gyrase/topoisomerase IV subunit A n=1 Tax=Ancylothrix sp. D3o TaxID=2953691 RepID=UPI0021BAD3E9|nr:DNA topoisomerase (ATP-hydrolyzing) [Ancylothrix sp. D3o]MCT7949259.1 DNA topoisomerase 4 subunit A [Ancylothrix sp. D3o]